METQRLADLETQRLAKEAAQEATLPIIPEVTEATTHEDTTTEVTPVEVASPRTRKRTSELNTVVPVVVPALTVRTSTRARKPLP